MSTRHRDSHTKHSKAATSAQSAASSGDDRRKPSRLTPRFPTDQAIPPTPFLLTLHSDYPYRVSQAQADSWRSGHHWRGGCPFDADEEALQYTTFLSSEWEHTILSVEGTWDKQHTSQNGPALDDRSNRQPTSAPTKTKLSLKDYKMKISKGAVSSGTEEQPSAKHEGGRNGTATEERNAVEDGDRQKLTSTRSPEKRGEKRSLDATSDARPSHTPQRQSRDLAPVAKRARTSPSPRPDSSEPQHAPGKTKKPSTETKHGLPPMLSPTLPPHAMHGLPPLLSPTLPPSIEKDLLQFEHRSSAKKASPSRDRTSRPRHTDVSPSKSTVLEIKSVNQEVKATAAGPATAGSNKADSTAQRVAPSTAKVEPLPRKSRYMVRLKYGRNRRKDVQRILNITPRPKKLGENSPAGKSKQPERDSGRAQDGADRQGKSGDKRPRTTEDERSRKPSSKRSKATPPEMDLSKSKSRTPVPPSLRSPAVLNPGGSTLKAASGSSANLKSADMRRVDSAEANARTPKMARGTETPSQPPSTEKPLLNGESKSGSGSAVRSKEIDALKREYQRILEVGKRTKHEGQEALFAKGEASSPDEPAKKRGAALLMESILCWMLAFALNDEAQRLSHSRADVKQWRSLLPFWKFVETRCRPFTALHGLCLQVGAVCHETIHSLDMERLSSSLLNDEKTSSIIPDFVKDARAMRQCWTEGLAELSAEKTQKEFPETWRKSRGRIPVAASKETERPAPGRYGGDFYLPLSSVSTPMEAVRATAAILREWTKREGVSWKGLLEI